MSAAHPSSHHTFIVAPSSQVSSSAPPKDGARFGGTVPLQIPRRLRPIHQHANQPAIVFVVLAGGGVICCCSICRHCRRRRCAERAASGGGGRRRIGVVFDFDECASQSPSLARLFMLPTCFAYDLRVLLLPLPARGPAIPLCACQPREGEGGAGIGRGHYSNSQPSLSQLPVAFTRYKSGKFSGFWATRRGRRSHLRQSFQRPAANGLRPSIRSVSSHRQSPPAPSHIYYWFGG